MFETNPTNLVTGYSGTTINGGTGTYFPTTSNLGLLQAFNNLNNMHRNQQVKVAVFGVKRTEDGNIQSSKFIKELWVERKEGISIELVVAKELDSDYNPEEIVVKEIYSVNF